MKASRLITLVILMLVALQLSLMAQTQEGRISGRVTDQTVAVVVKATVTIQNLETGVKRVLRTNSEGEYAAPNLSPGLYSVSVSVPTFKTVERKGIRLEVATDVPDRLCPSARSGFGNSGSNRRAAAGRNRERHFGRHHHE